MEKTGKAMTISAAQAEATFSAMMAIMSAMVETQRWAFAAAAELEADRARMSPGLVSPQELPQAA